MLFRPYFLHPFAFLGKKVDIKEKNYSHVREVFSLFSRSAICC